MFSVIFKRVKNSKTKCLGNCGYTSLIMFLLDLEAECAPAWGWDVGGGMTGQLQELKAV